MSLSFVHKARLANQRGFPCPDLTNGNWGPKLTCDRVRAHSNIKKTVIGGLNMAGLGLNFGCSLHGAVRRLTHYS
jgi:hypothetical protein